ncbi:MAG: M48 family metallopeptidase [Gemmatimonadales bacterium]
MSDQNLFAQQESNKRKSAWLVAGFLLFFAWIGFGGDLALYLGTRDLPPEDYHHVVPWIGLVATTFALVVAWTSWRNGARRVLVAAGAWELVEPATPEQKRLRNVIEEMAIASGLPVPRIWIIPDDDPNAFATGRDPFAAHVAVTEGLLARLDRDELQGVVAHEMSHIRNYDIRLMTLLAALVGAIALLSDGMRQFLRFGGGRSRGGKKGGNPLALVVLALWLISLIVAPIVSSLLSMAVSRKRELLADATGSQLTRNPLALASALEKLAKEHGPTRTIARGAAHMCIVDPGHSRFAESESGLSRLFSSHPPIRIRLARLRAMGYQAVKRGDGEPDSAGLASQA